MGIDVYLRWPDMSKDENEAQYTGFSIEHGHVGYLREAYHGGPYATKVLFDRLIYWEPAPDDRVDWDKDEYGDNTSTVEIDVPRLRAQLEPAIETARERDRKVYRMKEGEKSYMVDSLRAFVDLAVAKRKEHGHVGVYISY